MVTDVVVVMEERHLDVKISVAPRHGTKVSYDIVQKQDKE